METELIRLFQSNQNFAFLISIILNVIIAVIGVIPSVFITAANIVFFGFWKGLIISYIGEAAGAIVAFMLYRKGTRKFSKNLIDQYPKWTYLLKLDGWKAFYTIIGFRLIPYIPSGVVTLLASLGKISLVNFGVSSTIGKFPALLLEGYSVYQVTNLTSQGKAILFIVGFLLVFRLLTKERK